MLILNVTPEEYNSMVFLTDRCAMTKPFNEVRYEIGLRQILGEEAVTELKKNNGAVIKLLFGPVEQRLSRVGGQLDGEDSMSSVRNLDYGGEP